MNYPRKFVKLPIEVEVMRVIGAVVDRHKVYTWMVDNGYPQLFGNALNPKELYDPVLVRTFDRLRASGLIRRTATS